MNEEFAKEIYKDFKKLRKEVRVFEVITLMLMIVTVLNLAIRMVIILTH